MGDVIIIFINTMVVLIHNGMVLIMVLIHNTITVYKYMIIFIYMMHFVLLGHSCK